MAAHILPGDLAALSPDLGQRAHGDDLPVVAGSMGDSADTVRVIRHTRALLCRLAAT